MNYTKSMIKVANYIFDKYSAAPDPNQIPRQLGKINPMVPSENIVPDLTEQLKRIKFVMGSTDDVKLQADLQQNYNSLYAILNTANQKKLTYGQLDRTLQMCIDTVSGFLQTASITDATLKLKLKSLLTGFNGVKNNYSNVVKQQQQLAKSEQVPQYGMEPVVIRPGTPKIDPRVSEFTQPMTKSLEESSTAKAPPGTSSTPTNKPESSWELSEAQKASKEKYKGMMW